MKELVQRKGYRITVVSWENDADNYNTEDASFTDYKEALEIHAFLKWLRDNDQYTNKPDCELEPEVIEEAENILQYTLKKFKAANDISETDDYIEDFVAELLYDFGLSSEWYFPRHVETVTMHYFDKDVYAEKIS